VDDAKEAYRSRLQRAAQHIERHLEEDLSVERLAHVAAFSKYHFHRQFSAAFGVGVYEYVQLFRLRRASYALAFRDERSVLEIALGSGYDSPEAFARAFKKRFGQTPTEFRKQPDWLAWHEAYGRLQEARSHMKDPREPGAVKIVLFEETRVALLEHRGDPRTIGDTIRTFIDWRKKSGLPPRTSATFNLLYNDPNTTPPEDFRLGICAATAKPIGENDAGVTEGRIPAGRCAVIRHVGSDDTLSGAFHRLYSEWLPSSGEEPRDFPLFLQRVSFFPDVPEHEAITDIFLPLV
jgi:AraC family transcriptional regulator